MIIFAILTALFVLVGFPLIISYGLYPNETSKQIKDLFNVGPKYNIQDEMSFFNEAEWVKKVILSCNTTKQIWNAYELSKILRNKYNNKVETKIIWSVSDEISRVFDNHHDRLITK